MNLRHARRRLLLHHQPVPPRGLARRHTFASGLSSNAFVSSLAPAPIVFSGVIMLAGAALVYGVSP
ncbi:hypothetical protein C7999DRAFT_34603, partial [Corynascus novoguineensis]